MRRRKTFVKYLKSLRQQARDSLIDADAAFVDELRRKNILPELPEDKKVKRRRKKPPDGWKPSGGGFVLNDDGVVSGGKSRRVREE